MGAAGLIATLYPDQKKRHHLLERTSNIFGPSKKYPSKMTLYLATRHIPKFSGTAFAGHPSRSNISVYFVYDLHTSPKNLMDQATSQAFLTNALLPTAPYYLFFFCVGAVQNPALPQSFSLICFACL
jgi:hypothetical protein